MIFRSWNSYRDLPRDHAYETADRIREKIALGDRRLAEAPFYKDDHTPTFRAYFSDICGRGIEVFSTVADSVIVDAGGTYIAPNEILALA